jgi:hypothetical protein
LYILFLPARYQINETDNGFVAATKSGSSISFIVVTSGTDVKLEGPVFVVAG